MSNLPRRKCGDKKYKKKIRTISFTGRNAHEVLDFLDTESENHPYGKSGMMIELLLLYREAKNTLGEDAMSELKVLLKKRG